MMKWSKQQLACIEHKDHPIIVSASAGAGKTAVLTERITKRCLVDGIDMNRIVALTFTAAAANEMKDRIHKRLVQIQQDQPEKSEIVIQQLALLQEAQISTIHSFCLNIIKKYGYLIGFDQQRTNRLFSDVSLKLLKNQAFEQTLASLDEPTLTLLSEYFSTKPANYDALQETLTHLLDQANNQCDPQAAIDSIANLYQPIQTIDQLDEVSINALCQLINHNTSLISANLATLKAFGSEKYLAKAQKKIDALETFIHQLMTLVENKQLNEIESLYRYGFKGKLTVSKSSNNLHDSQTTDTINKLVEGLFNATSINQVINDNNALIPVTKALSQTLSTYRYYFELAKENANGIDFNDMEYYAFKILDENESVSKYYQAYYQEICVDEFQDTSIRQNAIIEAICNGKNIFRVGDIKQSIYRFRQASPQLMKSLMENGENEVIILEENYRSSASIIDFTNHLFSQIMNVGLPNNQYLNSDNVTPGTAGQKSSYLPIEFYGLDTQSYKENKLTNGNVNKAKAMVALIEKYRKETPFTSYKDYCILVRSRTAMHYLKTEFEKASIPYKMDLKNGFSSNHFIQTLKAFFTLLLDSNDELSLVTLLTSPYYNYSLQQLYNVKYNENNNKDIDEINEFINECKPYIHQGINAVLSKLLSFKSIYQRLTREDRFNVDYLMQLIQTNNIVTINDVLTFLDTNLDEDSSQILGIGKDDDVVSVMTIHQSKGLQFPVVLLWSDSKNSDMESKSNINWDNQFNIGLKAIHLPGRLSHPSLFYSYNSLMNNKEDLAERIRLLYVAITRAKEKCIIVDMVNKVPDVHTYTLQDVYLRKGFTHDILSTCPTNQLFQFKHIYTPFANVTNPTLATPNTPILTYTKTSNKVLKTSASSTIVSKEIQLLQNNGGVMYGSLLHETLQALDFNAINDDLLKSYNPSLTQSMRTQLINAAKCFVEFSNENKINQWLKELPFMLMHDSTFITGSIDAIGISENTIAIIDYKTTNASINELIDLYSSQLTKYKEIITKAYPNKIINCYIYSFKHNRLIQL